MKPVRQGDVLLEPIDSIPANAKRRRASKLIILARGEATGHHHSVAGDAATAYDDAGVTYLEVQEAMAMLTHQEHGVIELPRGKYRMVRQKEFAPEAPRQVAD